ncbi:hypothetical protein A2631_05995 [Candidatus Daviesbacteria bacterium RIFCSPHIGHO2_01_FULL_44_29]|uniref:Peptidase M41 domain-containing protein n=1 Tax=Candidatus Daviesbacteria bacterium RIFCSPHIGHO2_02_FULL_43_12 TaxID=1797776 RepID=A0A1F5KJ20_9BACT|nr:MAG: hypothetical protein A2631_05995 [Candidatus Daviesbacteria bacterium RIFCSPHIGHO2_01_FULL_44_29]OGE39144.1 MAG: hypothetical protein A3E86_03325 [Candidatus Daviesbacteria bacterium RIFCSPHIGHO2_12_FULL_47_45]OGE40947.1 MAG: hypothetical protein A3D25_02825 [Candidatus Daviesbacteria bacterium RIFCSPHIGHO2_02_FULL_43_12]OGE69902.1 MAG: hypothetical protein A3B55_05845 [Candidatus Daviesbacteria bacterium RIFCSPLOWO2_01_FULL_43_15]
MIRNIEGVSFLNMSDTTRLDAPVLQRNLDQVRPELRQDLINDYRNGEVSADDLANKAFIRQEEDDDEVAYHEAAHYVVGGGISATIIPSSEARGLTILRPDPIRTLGDIEKVMVTCYAGGMGSEMRGRGARGCGSDIGQARFLARLHSRFSGRDPRALEQAAEMSARCEVHSRRYQIENIAHKLRRRKTIRG